MIRVDKPNIEAVDWQMLQSATNEIDAQSRALDGEHAAVLSEWRKIFERVVSRVSDGKHPLESVEWDKALEDWQDLLRAAVENSPSLLSSFDETASAEIDDRIYKKYMRFLITLFNGKCAYCETDIESNQPGDVEHFRPKGRVVDDNFKPIRIQHPKWGEIDHPGYFWLAYDWTNLLPSCIDCNRYRKHGGGLDSGAGKADRFPVDGFRAFAPADVIKERALLANPSLINPDDHFEFRDSGLIEAKTDIGEATLSHLGLNRREKLVKARKLAYSDAKKVFEGYINAVFTSNTSELGELRDRINDMWLGREPYAAMQRLGIHVVRSRGEGSGFAVPLPLP